MGELGARDPRASSVPCSEGCGIKPKLGVHVLGGCECLLCVETSRTERSRNQRTHHMTHTTPTPQHLYVRPCVRPWRRGRSWLALITVGITVGMPGLTPTGPGADTQVGRADQGGYHRGYHRDNSYCSGGECCRGSWCGRELHSSGWMAG